MKKILITGISGQDGAFLTDYILKNEYDISIFGTTRNKELFFNKLNYLNPNFETDKVSLTNLNMFNKKEVLEFIQFVNPDYVYNLTGPSSVYESIKTPDESIKKITTIFNNLTESLIKSKNFCNFFQSSSSEMFGNTNESILNENSNFKPNSPYATAKLINHESVINLNKTYDWPIVSGIMFNHESEFRTDNYLFPKIINSAIKIYFKKDDVLEIGSLDYKRDWSYAKDIIEAVNAITENPKSSNYVIGSGVSVSIKDIVECTFDILNLNYKNHIKINPQLLRRGDPVEVYCDTSKLTKDYSWKPKHNLYKMISKILDYKLKSL